MPVLGLPALSVVAAAQTVAGAGGAAIASPVATAMTAAAGQALRNRVHQYRKKIAATTSGGNEPPRGPPTSSTGQPPTLSDQAAEARPNGRRWSDDDQEVTGEVIGQPDPAANHFAGPPSPRPRRLADAASPFEDDQGAEASL